MLKSLLSLLLSLFYSKSESAEVASQSLPNETDFTSVTLNTSQPDTFAAPYDGYLCIVVDTGGSINVWGDGLQSSNYSLNNGQSKLFVPMRKGNIIGYSISGRLIFGKFYKLVGGGYNTIEKLIRRGGAICLSNLYNSLRKSSLSVKRSGCSKTLSPLKEPQLLSQINDQVLHLLRILLRQTDCLGFVIKQVRGITLHCLAIASVTEVTQQDGNFLRLTDGQLNTHFMYLREKSSNLIQTTKRQVLPECGSTRRLNSAVGGASC